MTREEREQINEYLLAYSQGDIKAFEEFYRQFFTHYLTFIKARVKNEHTAKDLTQDLFFKILNMDFSGINFMNMSAYLFQMAKNIVCNHTQKVKKKREVELMEDIIHYDQYENCTLNDLIADFTKQEIEILKLRFFYGYELKYIAKELGLSVSTLLRRIDSIKKKIKKTQVTWLLFVFLLLLLLPIV